MSLTNTNIDTLLSLCKQHNQLAQLEVYNRYHRAMYNVSLRIVKDTAVAEDSMQESFITAFNKLDSFKGTATFGAWLKRIVINNSIAQYKKSSRYVSIEDHDGVTIVENANYELEDYTTVKANELMISLNKLHDNYRQALTLHYIEGYDYEELSEILNLSYGSCRTLISRAKESLRKKLSQKK